MMFRFPRHSATTQEFREHIIEIAVRFKFKGSSNLYEHRVEQTRFAQIIVRCTSRKWVLSAEIRSRT